MQQVREDTRIQIESLTSELDEVRQENQKNQEENISLRDKLRTAEKQFMTSDGRDKYATDKIKGLERDI